MGDKDGQRFTVFPDEAVIRQALSCPSPNQDERPVGCEPILVIIHGISLPPGEYGGHYIEQLFTNCLDWNAHPYFSQIQGMKVSSHLLVKRNGELIQFVPFNRRAWHAGESVFRGRGNCNDFSIGIELEGCDDSPYSDEQYRSLIDILRGLLDAYPGLSPRSIAGHSDVAPGRKSDPGPAFDWLRLYDGLA
jgi:AmpD protein